MAGARQDQLSWEGQHASEKVLGVGSLVVSFIRVERNTPSHCLYLGGPASNGLGLSIGLNQPGSLGCWLQLESGAEDPSKFLRKPSCLRGREESGNSTQAPVFRYGHKTGANTALCLPLKRDYSCLNISEATSLMVTNPDLGKTGSASELEVILHIHPQNTESLLLSARVVIGAVPQ